MRLCCLSLGRRDVPQRQVFHKDKRLGTRPKVPLIWKRPTDLVYNVQGERGNPYTYAPGLGKPPNYMGWDKPSYLGDAHQQTI